MPEAKVIPTPPILKTLFGDIGNEPDWRGQAAKEKAWENSIQWAQSQLDTFQYQDMPKDIFVNLINSAMNAVTGYEAKHRVDWMLSGADEEHDELAEGLNHKLNDEMRLADANTA